MQILRSHFVFAALFLTAASVSAFDEVKPPAEITSLSAVGTFKNRYPYESWGQVTFRPDDAVKRGRHWNLFTDMAGIADNKAAWVIVKPELLKNGWTVVNEYPYGGFLAVILSARNGVEAWANLTLDELHPGVRVGVDLIEVSPLPISLTLKEPGQTPETMPSPIKGDFPYLGPIAGSEFRGGQQDPAPFMVTPKGASQDEIMANGSLIRGYRLDGMSNLLFTAVYHDALTKAGWEIVDEKANGEQIIAHYTKKGRNIWATLHNNANGYDIRVSDAGGVATLKTGLEKTCHVALYGVLFDFNKATLQPASDGPLQQVTGLMSADKTLKLEVQGHTDNVGTDAYNQTLSENRARAVVAWLTQHGVAADRLSATGYGMKVPVADNRTDEGRAKNRRVEIADPRCTSGRK